jgi:hypothetical protein
MSRKDKTKKPREYAGGKIVVYNGCKGKIVLIRMKRKRKKSPCDSVGNEYNNS